MTEISQETALNLLNEGGVLIIHDVPEGTEFGVDYNSWSVGPLFRGVKMIPPGLHFIYFSSVSKTGQIAPRTGFFYTFRPAEVVVMKWNADTEEIVDSGATEVEKASYRSGIIELDRFLGPYPHENNKKWLSLTNHISEATVLRLQPKSRRICSVSPVNQQTFSSSSSEKSSPLEDEKMSTAQSASPHPVSSDDEIKFSEFSLRDFPPGCSPEDITRHSIDKSFVLEKLIDKLQNEKEIIAELQFSFVCFLIGQVYDGFEQWKKLLHLLCLCDEALTKHSSLYYEFIGVLHYQLLETPLDFVMDIVSNNNFLTSTLQELFLRIDSASDLDTRLAGKTTKFKSYLERKYGLSFETDSEDCAPVVVEL